MKDRTGSKFGRLTFTHPSTDKTHDGTLKWWLICECGTKILRNPMKVVHGQISSCGCLHKEKTVERLLIRNTSHGYARRGKVSGTYRTWQYIFDRLKYDPHYANVVVCDRWLVFENFLKDMGERPEGMTLDRVDNSKGYEPGNCRWATQLQQQNNRTNNLMLTHGGTTMSLSAWCRERGWPYEATRKAYHNLGQPTDFIPQWEGLRDPLDM